MWPAGQVRTPRHAALAAAALRLFAVHSVHRSQRGAPCSRVASSPLASRGLPMVAHASVAPRVARDRPFRACGRSPHRPRPFRAKVHVPSRQRVSAGGCAPVGAHPRRLLRWPLAPGGSARAAGSVASPSARAARALTGAHYGASGARSHVWRAGPSETTAVETRWVGAVQRRGQG